MALVTWFDFEVAFAPVALFIIFDPLLAADLAVPVVSAVLCIENRLGFFGFGFVFAVPRSCAAVRRGLVGFGFGFAGADAANALVASRLVEIKAAIRNLMR